jgi:hypothetical protein
MSMEYFATFAARLMRGQDLCQHDLRTPAPYRRAGLQLHMRPTWVIDYPVAAQNHHSKRSAIDSSVGMENARILNLQNRH